MREQDVQLGEVEQSIGVLRDMGKMISTELDDQNELLEYVAVMSADEGGPFLTSAWSCAPAGISGTRWTRPRTG